MKLEDLDTLLRNKLQFKETEVSLDERNKVFAGVGISQTQERKPVYAWLAMLGCLILGVGVLLNSDKKNQIDTLVSAENAEQKELNIEGEIIENKEAQMPNSDPNQSTEPFTKQNNISSKRPMIDTNILNSLSRITEGISEKNNTKLGIGVVETKRLNNSIILTSDVRNIDMIVRSPLKEGLTASLANPIWEFDASKIKQTKGNRLFKYLNPQISIYSTALGSLEEKTTKEPNSDYVHKSYISEYNAGNQRNWTLNTGFNLKLNFLGFLNIGSGLGLINTGSSYDYDFLVNEIPVEDSATGFIFGYISRPDSISQRIKEKGKSSVTYLEVPLQFNFRLFNYKKWQLGIEGAYTFQTLIKSRGRSLNQTSLLVDGESKYTNRLRNYQIGLPITYNLSSRNSITIMPHWGKALGNTESNNNINTTRKYNGLRVSFNYNLIK